MLIIKAYEGLLLDERVKEKDILNIVRDKEYQKNRPPAIRVVAGEEKAALQDQQAHIGKAGQVPGGHLNRVIPEGVDDGPGKIVAVISAHRIADAVERFEQPVAGTLAGCPSAVAALAVDRVADPAAAAADKEVAVAGDAAALAGD